MKRLLTVLLILPAMLYAQGQSLSLQKAYELAAAELSADQTTGIDQTDK